MTQAPPAEQAPARRGQPRGIRSLDVLAGLLLLTVAVRPLLGGVLDEPAVQAWATVFVSLVIQAVPFLVLGVVISAAISTLVPPSFFARALPKRPVLAVPVAGAAGVVLPGCECGSVPIAGGLIARGVPPSAAFAFLLSAPAINPVVLIATAVAFPGRPSVVLARFLASLLTSVVMGWVWLRFGRSSWLRRPSRPELGDLRRWEAFRVSARHDFVHAGGFLVVGGMTAATLNVTVPRSVLDSVGGNLLLSVVVLGALAVVLAICSEADAFVAASLTAFPTAAQLAFMVVGPAVDVKLFALQAGTFGRRFALRFAPATFVVAVCCALGVGLVLL
ncbi:MAG: permease [Actinomycetota bacterium]|nr:permease [Actinomycetota bacterium]